MANRLLGDSRDWESLLSSQFTAHELNAVDIESTNGAKALRAAKNGLDLTWLDSPQAGERFDAFSALEPHKKEAIMAYCVAITTMASPDAEDDNRSALGARSQLKARLVQRSNFDLRRYWQPTCANFFSRVDKASLLDICSELVGPEFAKSQSNFKRAHSPRP